MVRSGVGGGCFWSFGGGCGTKASNPLGVSGVITMKMISNTSRTSINGVTFMFAFWPPLGPTAIAISISSTTCLLPVLLLSACRCRWRCDRRRSKRTVLLLFGQKSELVYAGGTDIIHHLHYPSELRPRVGLEKNTLVGAISQAVFDLLRQVVGIDGVGAEENLVVTRDGNLQRIFFVGIVHINRIVHLRHVDLFAVLQHG